MFSIYPNSKLMENVQNQKANNGTKATSQI